MVDFGTCKCGFLYPSQKCRKGLCRRLNELNSCLIVEFPIQSYSAPPMSQMRYREPSAWNHRWPASLIVNNESWEVKLSKSQCRLVRELQSAARCEIFVARVSAVIQGENKCHLAPVSLWLGIFCENRDKCNMENKMPNQLKVRCLKSGTVTTFETKIHLMQIMIDNYQRINMHCY